MNCKKCNFVNERGSIFCESCGEKMTNKGVDGKNKTVPTNENKPTATDDGENIVCSSCDNKNPSDSNFCENCGSKLSGPEIPARLVNSNGEIMRIMSEKNVFGRQDFVKWVPEEYNDPRISREHIRIDYENKKYFLSLAKAQVNVTKLNDAPIAGSEKYELKNQDKIDIALGRLVVVFEVDEPDLDKKDKVSDEKETGKSSKEKDNDDKVESSK